MKITDDMTIAGVVALLEVDDLEIAGLTSNASSGYKATLRYVGPLSLDVSIGSGIGPTPGAALQDAREGFQAFKAHVRKREAREAHGATSKAHGRASNES